MSINDPEICTPPEIVETAKETSMNLLPEKSKKKYEAVYKMFMEWRSSQNITSFSENVLLAYFAELSEKYKSSSLWAQYSILRSTISLNNNINIENYCKLRAFLKRKSEGYQAKKAKTFTSEEINKFLTKAPDAIYLATKVSMIMGIMGACRANELHSMKFKDVQDLGSALLVTIPYTKTKVVRKFTITGEFYHICMKYVKERSLLNTSEDTSFFLNYQKGKCTSQKIGINKFGAMGKHIASFLDLPNPEMYTGHCFRRSSATLLVDAGGDITALKRHGGWRSTSVAESYIDDSMKNKMDTANKILRAVQNDNRSGSSSSLIQEQFNDENNKIVKTAEASVTKQSTEQHTYQILTNANLNNTLPLIHFSNCSDIHINFVTKNTDNNC